MGGKMSRDKGKRGEREIIDLLQPVVNEIREHLQLPEMKLKRNTLQSDSGGSDVAGLPWMALEVKLHATLNLNQWWVQTISQAEDGQEPILFYRTDRKGWRVRMWGWLDAWNDRYEDRCVASLVDIAPEDFLRWFRARLVHELIKHEK